MTHIRKIKTLFTKKKKRLVKKTNNLLRFQFLQCEHFVAPKLEVMTLMVSCEKKRSHSEHTAERLLMLTVAAGLY